MKILLSLVSKTLPLIVTLFCLLIFRLQHRQIQALTEQNQALTHTFSTQSKQFQATLKAIETTNEISKQHFYASESQWADSQANKIFIKKTVSDNACTNRAVPAAAVERLHQHTRRIRDRVLSGDTRPATG
ncbi:hypothetical protein [Arsenophonus nasoniae]|uniref:DUF2570 domain-containing protein n=1 Tax=Arsenophonus nasoniae TaxID=638 RepID=A0AA95K980_9GAMM|nr:hypothetical protein [Arsenophonus nasoniae]WGL96662.1 hypothetical protein QE207_09090 [Arsenophonus nasoniae]